jgi:integrase
MTSKRFKRIWDIATAAFTLDVYGHVTAHMKQESAKRMEQFIQSVSGA